MEEYSAEALWQAVEIFKDTYGRKIVLINDIRFKGTKRDEWKDVEKYLRAE